MSDELKLVAVAILAGSLAALLVPVMIALATRTGFLDHPVAYKAHGRSTPYLGGLAVISAAVIASLVFSSALSTYGALILGMLGLCAVGTIDDRIGLSVAPRVLAQVASAAILYAAGYHWEFGLGAALDFAVTAMWVVGVVNAFNLMDNLDGATGSVAAPAATGAGLIAASGSQWDLATLMVALGSASLVFLGFNLQRPSRVFLGDGGSTPIGYLIAGSALILPAGDLGAAALPAYLPLAGLAILDTTLVVISRRRRGENILSGARDHLTHRLLRRLGSPRRVALGLGLAQAALAAVAFGLHFGPAAKVWVVAILYSVLGLTAIALLETPAWRSQQMEDQAAGTAMRGERGHFRSGPALESAN